MSICRRSAFRIAYCGLVGTVLSASAPANLSAAVAPHYDRLRQLGVVMSAGNEAAAKLSRYGLIDRIERMDDGTFRFWAKRCFVPAMLEPLPANESPPAPGTPTDYRISLGDVRCE